MSIKLYWPFFMVRQWFGKLTINCHPEYYDFVKGSLKSGAFLYSVELLNIINKR